MSNQESPGGVSRRALPKIHSPRLPGAGRRRADPSLLRCAAPRAAVQQATGDTTRIVWGACLGYLRQPLRPAAARA